MIILHHYPMSPFSEKMRLMLGYCGLQWQSLISPESPPRPNLEPLAGGYRRIPVAQLGADLICDSRLISVEVAHITGRPELNPNQADVLSQQLASYCESEIFLAALSSIPARRLLSKLFGSVSFTQALRTIADRVGIARQMQSKPVSPKRAGLLLQQHLQQLEQMLSGDQCYLAGDAPGYLDFAAYHPLWSIQFMGGQAIPENLSMTTAWYQRLTAFGHGQMQQATASDGFAAARNNEPRPISASAADGAGVGGQVVVKPDDYALDGTAGMLVGADTERWIVALDSSELGRVHVHFPRQGFCLGSK